MRMRACHLPVAILVALLVALALPIPGLAAKPWIGVDGSHLVDRQGRTVRLLGVNRSGAEYACVEEGRILDGPTDWASIKAMKSWHINTVRLPLNESCWLGIGGVDPRIGGAPYRTAIREYVAALEKAGLYVILDLHWAAPQGHLATGLLPLPDADFAAEFWRSVATDFRADRSVLFDVFNEPHDVTWDCWVSPCQVHDLWFGWYQATSIPELLAAVRSAGARQPVLLSGLDWSRDLRGVAANHHYDFNPCYRICRKALANVARHVPVVTAEFGEADCLRRYVNPYMRWADRHGISYLGWSWNTEGRWDCAGGPSLIRDWAGNPTRYGVGLRKHLRRFWRSR
jgi:hypothetical protein